MHLSPEISKLLDAGKDEEAIEMLTNDLVALRQRRVQAGQKASTTRSRSKSQKAKDQAGVKTPERQVADKMVEDMLKMQQEQNTIELSLEGGENDVEEPRKKRETKPTAGGVAKKRK